MRTHICVTYMVHICGFFTRVNFGLVKCLAPLGLGNERKNA